MSWPFIVIFTLPCSLRLNLFSFGIETSGSAIGFAFDIVFDFVLIETPSVFELLVELFVVGFLIVFEYIKYSGCIFLVNIGEIFAGKAL